MRDELTKVEPPLTPRSTFCALITGDGNLKPSISEYERIKTVNQFSQRKHKLLMTEDEIWSFTHFVYFIEPLFLWRKQNVKNSTQSLSSETLTNVEATGWRINWQKRSFTAKGGSTLGEERKSTQKCSLWQNWETPWVLYGSYERISYWVELLWVVLCKVAFSQYIYSKFYFVSRWSNCWLRWHCGRRFFFWKNK